MPSRIIENDYDRKMLIRFIEGQKLPMTVNISAGGIRSAKQNRLNRQWMGEIAEQLGDSTAEEWRGYCKLTIGVPILRAENDEFRARYDQVVRPLPYEVKLAMMQEPLDFPITRLMSVKQQTQYLDGVHRHFSQQGVVLTDPGDLLFDARKAA